MWYDRTEADVSRCLNPVPARSSDKIRLTGESCGLSGAFVVLEFGIGISLLSFMGELIYKMYWNRLEYRKFIYLNNPPIECG